jgi:NTP pyrophosphatase (non-canonical NTP hydrolase)
MNLQDLTDFAALQEKRFKTLSDGKNTPLERSYAQLAKLGEEYGELCEALMAKMGHQRQDKLDSYTDEALASEMADVAIVLFTLANNLGVDLPAALEKKIEVVNDRFKHISVA